MPPQQFQRLLYILGDGFDLGAHGVGFPSEYCDEGF